MKGGNERGGVRLNGFIEDLFAREVRKWRNNQDAELWGEETVRGLVMLDWCGDGIVALVQPHASGGGLGEAGVMEIVRELVSVARASDDQRQREDRKYAGLKELAGCQLQFRKSSV